MTVLFRPDLVLPHDPAGWGRWLIGHYLEHKQMVLLARGMSPPAVIPEYQIQQWSDSRRAVVFWLSAHQSIHEALRAQSGVTGIDLSLVDLNDNGQFEVWLEDHSTEHAALRSFYGIS